MDAINKSVFLEQVRVTVFDGVLPPNAATGLSALIDEITASWPDMVAGVAAFAAALMHYETTRRFAPIEERDKGAGKFYGYRLKRSAQPYTDTEALFYGRGIVPLVWYENYEAMGATLGMNLIADPELVMTLPVAVKVMLHGISEGLLTGVSIDSFVDGQTVDFSVARDVVLKGDRQPFFNKLCGLYLAAIEAAI